MTGQLNERNLSKGCIYQNQVCVQKCVAAINLETSRVTFFLIRKNELGNCKMIIKTHVCQIFYERLLHF